MLTLAEELLILALPDPARKRDLYAINLEYALPGAVLVELVLAGRLQLVQRRKFDVISGQPTGDDIFDEALARFTSARRHYSAQHWVSMLSTGIRNIKPRFYRRLVTKGIACEETRRALGIFPYRSYAIVDEKPALEIRARLRGVLVQGQPADPRTLALISLLETCQILGAQFERPERKSVRKRARELTRRKAASSTDATKTAAAASAAAAADAALMITVIAAAAATSD